jgi:hypothetical protein
MSRDVSQILTAVFDGPDVSGTASFPWLAHIDRNALFFRAWGAWCLQRYKLLGSSVDDCYTAGP